MTATDPTHRPAGRVVDADGHVWEDRAGVIAHLPELYRSEFQRNPVVAENFLFPPLDTLHSMPVKVPILEHRRSNDVGPSEWLEFLDAVGIAQTVLYPTRGLALGKLRDAEFAVALARAYNEWLAATYVAHPSGRFTGVAILPMQAPDQAACVLRDAVEQLGLKAGMISANGYARHLGSAEYWPVYAEAERLGVPLSFHGGSHDGMGFDHLNAYAPIHALGHPTALLTSLAGLLFNRVYERFPGLRTAYLEGGSAWILLARERFAESAKAFPPYDPDGPILCPPAGVGVDDVLIDLLADGRIVLGCEGGEHDLAYVSSMIGRAPFMYSSDFPHEVDAESCAHELEELDELDLSAGDKHAILSANADAFYGIGDPG